MFCRRVKPPLTAENRDENGTKVAEQIVESCVSSSFHYIQGK